MHWKPATRGNSEHFYLQVGFGSARALWPGMGCGCKHPSLIPKVAGLKSSDRKLFWRYCFIPNLNPSLNHSELTPEFNLKHFVI